MYSLTVKSPAKINLILYVLGRRPDGYHTIATLFHRLSLFDTIRIRKSRSGFRLRCNDSRLPTDESNLVTKAYRALQFKIPKLSGLDVTLTKRIPLQAGLGGGSSNAAFFLLAANRLLKLGLSRRELIKMGSKLGADVPFFLYQVNQAFGTVRGDRIKPRPVKAKLWFLLVMSRQGLSTKTIYQRFKSQRKAPSLTKVTRAVTMLCDFWERRDTGQIAMCLHNDLESSAFRIKPSLRNTIKIFENAGIPAVKMSGSGPTVFAVFLNAKKAHSAARVLKKKFPRQKLLIAHTW